jgi:citrate lyase subunit beta / citryl-CoA lyase
MDPRSMLFVPGDSERKLAKGESSGADALVLDLEDSVPAERLVTARSMVREYLASHRERARQQLWVRINPLSTAKALPDLAAITAGAPDGILLPKTESADDVVAAGHYLLALEVREGLPPGSVRIFAVATETPAALFTMGSFAGCSPRLAGLTWGAEDLSAALGAVTNRDDHGELEFTYRLARSLCLAAAVAAGVQPLDTVFTDFRDSEGLRAESRAAARGGFTGKIAIHPDQVPVINQAFTPTPEDIAYAQRVIEAFAAGAGTVALDGKMLDMPHLKQAQRILALGSVVR